MFGGRFDVTVEYFYLGLIFTNIYWSHTMCQIQRLCFIHMDSKKQVYHCTRVYHFPRESRSTSQVALVGKNLPASAGRCKRPGVNPWIGKVPWNGHPFQCSCLEKPMDRGAWWASQSWTQLKRLSTHMVWIEHHLMSYFQKRIWVKLEKMFWLVRIPD